MTHGQRKGQRAEREVAKICECWWRRLYKTAHFTRTPISGGWSIPDIRGHFRACGDIMTTSEKWPFTVEVKRRENWSVGRLFEGRASPVWKWWIQAQRQADEEGGVPMLWFKRNPERPGKQAFPWCVMLPGDYCDQMKLGLRPDVMWGESLLLEREVDFGRRLPVLFFSDRLESISPKRIKPMKETGRCNDAEAE